MPLTFNFSLRGVCGAKDVQSTHKYLEIYLPGVLVHTLG